MKSADNGLQEISNWMSDFFENFNQGCLELVEEVEYCITEVESSLESLLDPVWQWLDGLDSVVEESSRPIVQTFVPAIQSHRACVGCRNYCGETYGGNLLVCAMHPYGANSDTCPDWESTWPSDRESIH